MLQQQPVVCMSIPSDNLAGSEKYCMSLSAGLSSQGGGVLAEEISLGRLRRYRVDAEDGNLLVIEDSQVRYYCSHWSNLSSGSS